MATSPIQNVPLQPLQRQGMQPSNPNANVQALAQLLGQAGGGGAPGVSPAPPADFSGFDQTAANFRQGRLLEEERESRREQMEFQRQENLAARAFAEQQRLAAQEWEAAREELQHRRDLQGKARELTGGLLVGLVQQAVAEGNTEDLGRYVTAYENLYKYDVEDLLTGAVKPTETFSKSEGAKLIGQGGDGGSLTGGLPGGSGRTSFAAQENAASVLSTILPALALKADAATTDAAVELALTELSQAVGKQQEMFKTQVDVMMPLADRLGETMAVELLKSPELWSSPEGIKVAFERVLQMPQFRELDAMRQQSMATADGTRNGLTPAHMSGMALEAIRGRALTSMQSSMETLERFAAIPKINPEALTEPRERRLLMQIQNAEVSGNTVLPGFGGMTGGKPTAGFDWKARVRNPSFQVVEPMTRAFFADEAANYRLGGWENQNMRDAEDAIRQVLATVPRTKGEDYQRALMGAFHQATQQGGPLAKFGSAVRHEAPTFVDPTVRTMIEKGDSWGLGQKLFGIEGPPPAPGIMGEGPSRYRLDDLQPVPTVPAVPPPLSTTREDVGPWLFEEGE